MRRRAAAAPLVDRQPPPVLRRPGAASALARGAGAAAVRGGDLRRGAPDRGRRDRVLRRARVDAAAVRAGARPRARDRRRRAARAGGGRPPQGRDRRARRTRCATWCPPPRPGVEETRVAFPGDLGAGPALDRYHELDACLEEIADWLRPRRRRGGRARAARRARRPGAPRDGAARRISSLLVGGPRARARALAGRLAPQRRPARVARRRQPGARARARRLPGPDRVHLGDADRRRLVRLPARARRPGRHRRRRDASPRRSATTARRCSTSPPDLPEPNARRASRPRAAARMAELCAITGGRALLLFTSFRNLRIAEAHLRETLPFPLLVQGERPRHLLLAALRERIGSVLLATQSFWEGVDVPGEALSLVVMDSIPFARPRRSADRGAHRSHPRRRRRAVRRLPAAARGAGAQAGVRPPHPQRAPTAASSPSSTGASRASSYGATLLASLPARLPAHRAAGGRRRVLDARATAPATRAAAATLVMNPWRALRGRLRGGIDPVRGAAGARQGRRPAQGRQRQHRRDQRRARAGQGLGDRRAGRRRRQGLRAGLAGPPLRACRPRRSRSPAAPRSSATCSRCSCAAAAARASRRRWASRWRCRRSPALVGFGAYVVVFAATRLSSLGSLLGVWTFALLFVLREQPPAPARWRWRSAAPRW